LERNGQSNGFQPLGEILVKEIDVNLAHLVGEKDVSLQNRFARFLN